MSTALKDQTYEKALQLLATRTTTFRKALRLPPGKIREPIPNHVGMREWLAVLGHDESRRPFDVIHVTGTKGKGSTCAWTDALLRAHFRSTHPDGTAAAAKRPKVGLYTSPHIVTERERIRIDLEPISEALFARHFFHVWNAILRHVGGDEDRMPGYLQLLALLSAYVFRVEGVAVAIYEVHAGGRYCSTNMWDAPVIAGLNAIALDHVGLLGNNVSEIAWNKAGVIKSGRAGSCAFSVAQVPEAREQLEREAEKLGCPLVFVNEAGADQSAVPADVGLRRPELAIPGPRSNLGLALHLANAHLERRDGERIDTETVLDALEHYQWPGRFQVVEPAAQPGVSGARWYLDFAHNELSLPVALDWFRAEVVRLDSRAEWRPRRRPRVLVFGHQSKSRDTAAMAELILRHCRSTGLAFDRVVLASHSRRSGRQVFDREEAEKVLDLWRGTGGWGTEVDVEWSATIQEAMETVERLASSTCASTGGREESCGAHALIVGSSHLVSSVVAAMPSRRIRLG